MHDSTRSFYWYLHWKCYTPFWFLKILGQFEIWINCLFPRQGLKPHPRPSRAKVSRWIRGFQLHFARIVTKLFSFTHFSSNGHEMKFFADSVVLSLDVFYCFYINLYRRTFSSNLRWYQILEWNKICVCIFLSLTFTFNLNQL